MNYDEASQSASERQISDQIWRVFGKDKVVDFRNNLIYAYTEDYANIHGIGGNGHAPNSTIKCVICDYTAGKGDKSLTVSYRLDVEDVDILVEAGKKAYFGELSGDATIVNQTAISQVVNEMRGWLTNIEPFPDNTFPIPYADIARVGQALAGINSAGTAPKWSYSCEKNNPYSADENGYVPVQKVQINYSPFMQDGSESRNPWYIGIENFQAPIKVMRSGASFHRSKDAINRKSAFIVLSKADFLRSMIAVKRFISHWESLYRENMMEAMRRAEYEKNQRS